MADYRKGLRHAAATALLALGLVALLMTGSASAMMTQLEAVSRATVSSSAPKEITVWCPAGKRVVGAGADVTPGNGHVLIDAIRPNATLTSVTARAREDENGTAATWYVAAYAVCAAPPSGLELRTATSASTSQAKSAVAACPEGKRLLGLGGEITSANGQVLLDGLFPNAILTQATVNALEDESGNTAAWQVSAYAICSNPVAGLVRAATTSAPGSPPSVVARAPCPAGKSLLSTAGTINSPNGQIVLDATFPDSNLTEAGFAAFEDETGNAGDWSLTAYAICAAAAKREAVSSPRESTASTVIYSANCPAGRKATGFGAEITGALGQAWVRFAAPLDAGFGYSAGIASDATGVASPFEYAVYGICVTPIDGLRVISESSNTDSTESRTVGATCPAGTRLVGGAALMPVSAHLVLRGFRPDPSLTHVTASAQEGRSGYDDDWTLIARAVCATEPPGLQLVQATSAFGSEEFATATAPCPAGKHLLGTGAEIVAGSGRVGFDDIRPDERLTSTVVTATEDELGTDADWRVAAYSICVAR